MINAIEFTNRIKLILEHHELTASQFADKIGVQRSSISHILSGRNKPSLDFVIKVTSEFDDVDLYWLLNGKGSFHKKEKTISTPTPTPTPTQMDSLSSRGYTVNDNSRKRIDKIVVFYNDGTFEEYNKG